MKARLSACIAVAVMAVALTGCPKDPYDPQTWIANLDDPAEVERAITELSRLKDPVAIASLGKTWRKYNKASKVLRVIVELADQAEGPPPDKKQGPFWDDAIPVLVEAVEEYERGNTRSIEDAAFAAEALGRSHNPEAVPVLVRAATKQLKKLAPDQRLRIAAVKALGSFPKDPKAIDTLIKVLNGDPEEQPINLNAAAAIALGETKSEQAIEPLLMALFEIPPIYPQARSALTKIGDPVIPRVIKVFQNQDEKINALAKKEGFDTDCDKAIGPESNCKAPGNIEFKAAALLGDLHAKEAVPLLVKELARKPEISFFDPRSGAPGPSSHNAVLDSLRNIGATEAADDVYNYMKDSQTDDLIRPLAIDVYSMLTRDTKALPYLASLMKDDEQEESIRRSAALAYARLVKSKSDLGALQYMIDRYQKEADQKRAAAAKAKSEDDKADLEDQALGYDGLVRFFNEHMARALTGIHCGDKAECYAGLLSKDADTLIKELGLPAEGLKKAQKENLKIAVSERALLDIGKMGKSAAGTLDAVLAVADSSERIIRQGALLAMASISEKPCKKCVERLDAIIVAQEDQSTLAALTHDTKVVRNYLERATK